MMKELNTGLIMNLIQTYRVTGSTTFLGCTVQEFHFKCYFINQKEKDPQEDPSTGGMRP
jgi:hypothetical protein